MMKQKKMIKKQKIKNKGGRPPGSFKHMIGNKSVHIYIYRKWLRKKIRFEKLKRELKEFKELKEELRKFEN